MGRSDIKTYSYQNVEEALSAVNAQDRGRYFYALVQNVSNPKPLFIKIIPNFYNVTVKMCVVHLLYLNMKRIKR